MCSNAQAESIREALVASKNTTNVYAIDEYHTYVAPTISGIGFNSGKITPEFTNEFRSLCPTPIEVQITKTDDLSGNKVTNLGPADEKADLYTNGCRCKDNFEVIKSYREVGGGSYGYAKRFIIKHYNPQPYVFKTPVINSANEVTPLSDGEIKSLKPKGSGKGSFGGFFSKMLDLTDYEGIDLYQYLRVLCVKNNGKPRYVINDPRVDEFREVDEISAFEYLSFDNKNSRKYFFACEGNSSFIVKGDIKITYTDAGRTSFNPTATYFSNRGLDGIKFTPKYLPSGTSPVSTPSSTSITTPETTGELPKNMEEQFAVEVANKKMTMTKVYGVQEYTGTYIGSDMHGCDVVTVGKNWDATAPVNMQRRDIYNYKVCNGVIAKAEETTPLDTQLPDGIEDYIMKVARIAQGQGMAQGNYQGYLITGAAIRDKDKCMVKIQIFKGLKTLSDRIVNGCQ